MKRSRCFSHVGRRRFTGSSNAIAPDQKLLQVWQLILATSEKACPAYSQLQFGFRVENHSTVDEAERVKLITRKDNGIEVPLPAKTKPTEFQRLQLMKFPTKTPIHIRTQSLIESPGAKKDIVKFVMTAGTPIVAKRGWSAKGLVQLLSRQYKNFSPTGFIFLPRMAI